MSTFRSISQAAATALVGCAVIGLVGALAVFFRQPWLIPSLGPTIFLQLVNAADPAARPRAILLGHAIGVAAGFGALFLCGAQGEPLVFGEHAALPPGRLAATALAVGATIFMQILAGAKHPPAAATTMLITLGGVKPAWSAVMAIAAGVVLAAGAAELGAKLLGPGLAGLGLRRKKAASVRGLLEKRAGPRRSTRKREPAEA